MFRQHKTIETVPATPRAQRMKALGALLLAVTSSGCFQYVRVPPTAVQNGEEVQVRISEGAAARLMPSYGLVPGELEGRLAEEGPDSVSISIVISRDYRGVSMDQVRQTMFLGRSEVLEVRRRQLSRTRTVLASAGVLVGFGVLIRSVLQEGDPNPNPDDPIPPPPPSPYRGLLRIPIRIPLR